MIFNVCSGQAARPIFEITVDGVTYTFDGQTAITTDSFLIETKGTYDWRMKIMQSKTVTISMLAFNMTRPIDIALVGRGGDGGNGSVFGGDKWQDWTACGGGGGGGGEVKNITEQQFAAGSTYTLCTSGSTYIKENDENKWTCNNGARGGNANANGWHRGAGGANGSNTGKGGTGALHYYSGSGGGNGADGYYVFGDSTFDGIQYGPCGGGGGAAEYGGGNEGRTRGAPGGGGHGGLGFDSGHGFAGQSSGVDGIIWIKTTTW